MSGKLQLLWQVRSSLEQVFAAGSGHESESGRHAPQGHASQPNGIQLNCGLRKEAVQLGMSRWNGEEREENTLEKRACSGLGRLSSRA